LPERYRAAHERALERVSASGEMRLGGRTLELTGLRRDGAEFPIELTLASWSAGDEIFYGGIVRDVSDRKAGRGRPAARARLLGVAHRLARGRRGSALGGGRADRRERVPLRDDRLQPEELLGAGTVPPYPVEGVVPGLQAFQERLAREGRGEADLELCRKDGSRFPP